MPQLFKVGNYYVYFWLDEGKPLEPVHFHISEGKPTKNATKVFITKNKKCYISYTNPRDKKQTISNIVRIAETQVDFIIKKWIETFGEINYYM